MSKARKKQKSKRSTPNISPLVLLRPRLDNLLGDESLAEKDTQTLKEDLDAVCMGVKPSDFLPVLLRAYQSAPTSVQAFLDDVVPVWLAERGHVDLLCQLVQASRLNPQSQDRALAWLQTAGLDPAALREWQPQSLFHGAYRCADDSQGVITIFWYTDGRRQKVDGMGFLIDFNPPWEGAIKDIFVCGPRSPASARQRYVDFWAQRGLPMQPISEAEVKRDVLQRLEINRREGIRLPQDLIVNRRLFVAHILSLPDSSETPRFSVEDFDELSRTGESVGAIRRFEQQVGRWVRMENGENILVMGAPFDEDV